MTRNQAKLIMDMVNERFAPDDEANRESFRAMYRQVRSQAAFQELLDELHAFQPLAKVDVAAQGKAQQEAERAARAAERPTEEGLYRNPDTGDLYRLRRTGHDLIVSKYSHTGSARRLTADGEVVKKGTWQKFNAFQSRQMLSGWTRPVTVKKSWLMSREQMIEYRYGICLFCMRGLEDAASVHHGYGPKCAKDHGLPWSLPKKDVSTTSK
jgi:hypothetical protein